LEVFDNGADGISDMAGKAAEALMGINFTAGGADSSERI